MKPNEILDFQRRLIIHKAKATADDVLSLRGAPIDARSKTLLGECLGELSGLNFGLRRIEDAQIDLGLRARRSVYYWGFERLLE